MGMFFFSVLSFLCRGFLMSSMAKVQTLILFLSLAIYAITPAIANPTVKEFKGRCTHLSKCKTEEQKNWYKLQSKITSKQCLDAVINGKPIGTLGMEAPTLQNPSGTKNIYLTKKGIWNIGIWYGG